MISRRTARAIAEVYTGIFYEYHSSSGYRSVDTVGLYDFLYDRTYAAWFCNKARKIRGYTSTRPLKDFIMKLHTGETLYDATPNWSWEERGRLGQRYLADLAKDILTYWNTDCTDQVKRRTFDAVKGLLRNLELDGYVYRDSRLLAPEQDILDVQEEVGVLESLFGSLGLANRELTLHHLSLSEEHYLAERWDDSISNSRKFLECVLQEVAAANSLRYKGTPLPESIYTRPVRVRDYLEQEGLLETKEKEAVAKVYGLLSHTGGHPYMAQSEQARLLRHLALTFSQFVMLRFQGLIAQAA
jgi:hypothetical protein